MGLDPTYRRRRQFLKVTGGAATAFGLAGCTGGTGGDGGGDGGDGGDGGGGDGGGGGSTGGDGSSGGDGGGDGGDGGDGMDSLSFDELVSRAQEEGQVTVFAVGAGEESLDKMFTEEYGIEVQRSRQGSSEVASRIIQGHTSGSQRIDVGALSLPPYVNRMADDGALATHPPVVSDEIDDITMRYRDNTVAESVVVRNLLWLHNGDVSSAPTTWADITSGDYVVSVNNEDPELLLAYEQAFGQETAREMIRQVGEVGTITSSHGGAAKGTAKGEYDVGLLMHKFPKLPWGENLYWQPKTYEGEPVPMTAVPYYAVRPKEPPHPHASWLFYQWYVKNHSKMESLIDSDRAYDMAGENPMPRTFYQPKAGHEAIAEDPNAVFIEFEMGADLQDRLTVWKDLLGIKS